MNYNSICLVLFTFFVDTKPKLKDIIKFVRPYAEKKWYEIGLELEIGDDEGRFLDEIKSSNAGNDQECFLEITKAWVRSDSASWTILKECLKELELHEAVEVLDSKSE